MNVSCTGRDALVVVSPSNYGFYFYLGTSVVARRLQSNPYIKRFTSGKRRSRVKFKKELAVVTEFNDKQWDEPKEWTSPVAAVLDQVLKDNCLLYTSPSPRD